MGSAEDNQDKPKLIMLVPGAFVFAGGRVRQLCGRRQIWGEGLIVKGDDQVERWVAATRFEQLRDQAQVR